MPMLSRPLHLLAGCFLAGLGLHASGGTGAYRLDWPHPGEVLTYRACGCADACWVAEVRHRRTQALQARLRCDCETLFYEQPSAPARTGTLGSCEPIHRNGRKPEAIRERLEQFLHPGAGGPPGATRP